MTPERLLDAVALPAAIWDSPQTIVAVNSRAQELTGFSTRQFAKQSSLWSRRVFADDRRAFTERQKQMAARDSQVVCEYRFYPNDATAPVRLREVVIPLAGYESSVWITTFGAIAEPAREEWAQGVGSQARCEQVDRCFHEIKNGLHLINMELELTKIESVPNLDTGKMTDALGRINEAMKRLQEHLLPPQRRGNRLG